MTTTLPLPRTGYDSLNALAIPTDAPIVAGYVDGHDAWRGSNWGRFPSTTRKIHITRTPSVTSADVLDIEKGAATNLMAVSWCSLRQSRNLHAGLYTDRANWGSLYNALRGSNIDLAKVWFWVAHWGTPATLLGERGYPGLTDQMPPAVGCQFADDKMLGHDYDMSRWAAHIPGIDPEPPITITGVIDLQLTDKLPQPSAARNKGTVEESLTTFLHGIAGVRDAGDLAIAISNLAVAMGHVLTNQAQIMAALDRNLKPAATVSFPAILPAVTTAAALQNLVGVTPSNAMVNAVNVGQNPDPDPLTQDPPTFLSTTPPEPATPDTTDH